MDKNHQNYDKYFKRSTRLVLSNYVASEKISKLTVAVVVFDPSEESPWGPFGADTFLPLKHFVEAVVAFDPFDWDAVVAAYSVVVAFEHSVVVVEQLVAVAVEGTVAAADFAFVDC